MPTGNPPSKNQAFYLVRSVGNEFGAFGPEYEEVTRKGLTSQKFSQTTPRGDLSQVPAMHFTNSEQEAREFIETVEGLQGYEVTISSTSTGKEWMVFLRRVAGTYRDIVDTGRGSYKIDFNLELQRTK